ncbi:MAG: ATPase [Spirochaetaceae bacterium]|jgi:hypothetical protein|nr:ATPase [Spirochaetaceae bacterium]
MEELQSTETLDREILEDARKKAYRILKTAEESVKADTENWAVKTAADITEVSSHYAQRLLTMKEELAARLILDKRRIRAEKIEGLLKSAMETYLLSLSRETLLSILEQTVRQRLDFLQKTGEFEKLPNLQVRSYRLEDDELETILNRCIHRGSWSPAVQESGQADLFGDARFPVILITAGDLRIVASVDAAVARLLEDKRRELTVSLLGEEILLEGGAI